MKNRLYYFLIGLFSFFVSGLAWSYDDGHENHAYHVANQDGLTGWLGDFTYDSGTDITTYKPDLSAPPASAEIDQIYMLIRLKSGIDTTIKDAVDYLALFKGAECGGETFSPSEFRMRIDEELDSLVVAYNFVDPSRAFFSPDFGSSSDCWTFKVIGNDPVEKVDIYVTYHKPGASGMPDYYASNPYLESGDSWQDGQSNLHTIAISDVKNEVDCQVIAEGQPLEPTNNLIVLVHGWNPDDHSNHYAPPPNGTCPTLPREEDIYDNDNESRNDFKWVHLVENLTGNPAVDDSWVVARYDWARDASTGDNSYLQTHPGGRTAANASRDAAFVHGLKLGKIIESLDVKKVQFIAHSAGNWTAYRAAQYLSEQLPSISIEVTSLDPFVNDDDPLGDIDLEANFEMMRDWVSRLQNNYVFDFQSDGGGLGWTSGDYDGWNQNVQIENLSGLDSRLYPRGGSLDSFLNNHGGPVYWYAMSADDQVDGHEIFEQYSLGFYSSLAWFEYITPPNIISTKHTDSIGTNIQVIFSKSMDSATLLADGNITVSGSSSGADQAKSLNYDAGTRTLTIDPDSAFNFGETITATLDTGVKDIRGTGLSNLYTVTFQVEPSLTSTLQVQSTLPFDGQSGIDPIGDIYVTFTTNVDTATVTNMTVTAVGSETGSHTLVISPSSGNSSSIVLMPQAPFATGETVMVTLAGAIASYSGTYLDGNRDGTANGDMTDSHEFQFVINNGSMTTNDRPPVLIATDPPNGSDNISSDTEITLSFNEEVAIGTINGTSISISGSSSGLHGFSVQAGSGGITQKVVLDPTGDFDLGETVLVTVSNAIENLDGEQITVGKTFYFTVTDVVITNVLPASFSGGTVTQNSLMTLANSPYVITSNLVVNAGATLRIEPGTVVKFEQARYLRSYGILDAQGTSAQPIYFTSLRDDSDETGGDTNGDAAATIARKGDWYYLNIDGASSVGSVLRHVEVRYGGYGSYPMVNVYRSTPVISESLFRDAQDEAISYYASGGTITGNTISGPTQGIYFTQDGTGTPLLIEGNQVSTTGQYGIRVSRGDDSTLVIRNNEVVAATGTGIHVQAGAGASVDVDSNTVAGADLGLSLQGAGLDRFYPTQISEIPCQHWARWRFQISHGWLHIDL